MDRQPILGSQQTPRVAQMHCGQGEGVRFRRSKNITEIARLLPRKVA
jgi:hypothetical protein